MKILITGGMGFVGSNLTEDLIKKGHEVIVLTRNRDKIQNVSNIIDQIKIEYVDVTEYGRLEKTILKAHPELIFHLAGQLTSYESFDNPMYDVDVNSKSTIAILETIRKMDETCKFILGSTFWVVGRPETLPINEETPCSPLNIYAANRLASEHYCKIYHDVYDLDARIMRLTNTFGIKEQYANKKKAALNYLIYMGFKGQTIPIYDGGKFFRDYIYVSDVVTAAEAIMERGLPGECYFVGTGKKTWFYEIGEMIGELTPGKIVYVESPDYHKRINVGSIVVDNSKLKKLGWNWKVSVRDGIKKVLEYYKDMDV